MRIAILGGGGAMGGLFGGYLARAGNDVTLIDVSEPAISAINGDGLTIEEKDGSLTQVKVPATADSKSVGTVELIINFVKCYHTEQAVRAAEPMIGKDTAVLSLQNGWGNAPRIADIVGKDRVLVGLTYHSGMLLAPGKVKHPGSGMTYVGELSGERTSRLDAIIETLRKAGMDTTLSQRILDEVWKKLALNACTLPTSGLLQFRSDDLVAYAGTKDLMAAILGEVTAVANAQNIALDYDERWAAITGLLEKAVGGKSSMYQDIEARRRTEIEVINGAIVDAGAKVGVATPVNQAMMWMVQAAQSRYLAAPTN